MPRKRPVHGPFPFPREGEGNFLKSGMYLTSTPGGDENGNTAIKSARNHTNAGRPVRSEYYNMQGQRNPYRRGAYIQRDVYGNGVSQSQKQIGR